MPMESVANTSACIGMFPLFYCPRASLINTARQNEIQAHSSPRYEQHNCNETNYQAMARLAIGCGLFCLKFSFIILTQATAEYSVCCLFLP